MKKGKYLLLMISMILLLTGCMKFNANMDIKKDKSMNFSIIYAFDTSMFGDTELVTDENKENLKKQGFDIADYSEDKMKGVTLTKKIKNIDDVSSNDDLEYNLSGIMEETGENPYIFKVKKGLLKNTYKAKFKFNTSDSNLSNTDTDSDNDSDLEFDEDDEDEIKDNDVEDNNDNDLSDMDLSNMTSSMDLSFNVTLPYGAKSNNATSTSDGNKKLSWNLATNQQEYIEFEFEIYNMTVIYIIGGAGVLLIIIIIALIVKKGKSKKNTGNSSNIPVQEVQTNTVNQNVNSQESNINVEPQNVQPVQPIVEQSQQPIESVQSQEQEANNIDVQPTDSTQNPVVSEPNVETEPQSVQSEQPITEQTQEPVDNISEQSPVNMEQESSQNDILEPSETVVPEQPTINDIPETQSVNQVNEEQSIVPKEPEPEPSEMQKLDPFGLNETKSDDNQ